MRHFSWFSALALLITQCCLRVGAFGTINEPVLLGQHNEHEMITRLAFQCPKGRKSDGVCFEPRSLDQLAGYHLHVLGWAIPGAGFNGAVGAPDTLDPIPEGPEAHCDDADYLDIPGYPQTRAQATARLQVCIDHLRTRFHQALVAAARLLDDRKRIREDMVDISSPLFGDCTYAFPKLQGDTSGRAKCRTLEGLGRALHGVQDFYSHSNWVDSADPNLPIGVSNPPGLGIAVTAPFLDLRATDPIPAHQIPINLSTGCFALPDTYPGVGECEGRITHHTLSKDNGVIHLDGSFGEVWLGSPRSRISDNFRRAVEAAVQSSRDTWAALQDAIRDRYGAIRGNLMICALIRDNPIKDCRNRTVAIALDKSWGSGVNGAIQLERIFAQELNSRLAMHALDKVAVLEFDEAPRLVYPMGYPKFAIIGSSNPVGYRRIDNALDLAIAENINAQPETYADRGAVLLLCSRSKSRESSSNVLAQVKRAKDEGIRVHYACIDIQETTRQGIESNNMWDDCGLEMLRNALGTGGVVAIVTIPDIHTPSKLIDLIMNRGLTATDDVSSPDNTRLYSGIVLTDLVSPAIQEKVFEYPVSSGEQVTFTIRYVMASREYQSDACLTVEVRDKGFGTPVSAHTLCRGEPPWVLEYVVEKANNLVFIVQYDGSTGKGVDTFDNEGIYFVVGVDSNLFDKVEITSEIAMSSLGTAVAAELPRQQPAKPFLAGTTYGNLIGMTPRDRGNPFSIQDHMDQDLNCRMRCS